MTDQQVRNKLRNYTVGIAGCGGLGSNCAVALARIGIGKLILADFDVVELSNLNRQYYFRHQIGMPKVEALRQNIHLIDPDVETGIFRIRIAEADIPGLFSSCDVVVEAFDKGDQKQMIIEAMSEALPDIPLVCGIGMAGWGNSNSIQTTCYDKLYICGDGVSEISEEYHPLAPKVGIVANMQANTVLEILLKKNQTEATIQTL
jgi:sulfur carrier protein ThiS adenylyltransferase